MADDLLHHDRQTMPSDLTSYLGLSFAVFLGLLPESYQSHLSSLHHRNRALAVNLLLAEEQLRLMKSRRQEDSKANARVVEIFANDRHAWQAEEKRLLQQLDAAAEEAHRLRARAAELEKSGAELREVVEKLQREVEEREEVINFMSRRQDAREKRCASPMRELGVLWRKQGVRCTMDLGMEELARLELRKVWVFVSRGEVSMRIRWVLFLATRLLFLAGMISLLLQDRLDGRYCVLYSLSSCNCQLVSVSSSG